MGSLVTIGMGVGRVGGIGMRCFVIIVSEYNSSLAHIVLIDFHFYSISLDD
jgi:hypothetical protein